MSVTTAPTIETPDGGIDRSGDIKISPVEDLRKYSVLSPRRIPCLRESLMSGIAGGSLLLLWRGVIKRYPGALVHSMIAYTVIASLVWPMCRYNERVRNERVRVLMEDRFGHHQVGFTNDPISEYERVKSDEEEMLRKVKFIFVEDLDAGREKT